MIEFWKAGGPGSLDPAGAAAETEAEGWDGQMFMDSAALGADPYVLMGHWAATTKQIKLSTGVTNPLTRHPAVTAAAAGAMQAISGGRYVLGIGRGDSALAYLGRGPALLPAFERALADIQVLLSGGEVKTGPDTGNLAGNAAELDRLMLGTRPAGMRLQWLPPDLPKVPLDVAATGPRVIALAARLAERITFSVGAMPERLAWAIDQARLAGCGIADRSDGDPSRPISFGAQVVVVCHSTVEAVRDAAARLVTPLARFQVIHQNAAAGPTQPGDEDAYAAIRRGYAMTKHSNFDDDKLAGESISADFVRRFAVVGTPEQCAARLVDLAGLGLERFVVFGPGFYDDGVPRTGRSLFAAEVMPAVRAALAGQVK